MTPGFSFLAIGLSLVLAHLAAPESCLGALDWKPSPGYRSAALQVPSKGRAGFAQLAPEQTRVFFTNHLSDLSAAHNQILMLGSGVALGDVDGDGWCDMYFCRQEGSNALYRNLGHWIFEDITTKAGVACANQNSTGAVMADVDGDGDSDLLVNAIGHGTRLFLNNGRGVFQESEASGLRGKFGATTLALADVDGDGDLDMYSAHYRTNTIRSLGLDVLNVNGKQFLRPEDRESYELTPEGFLLEHGEVDALYLNEGRGQFKAVPWNAGRFLDEDGKPLSAGPKDWGLTAMFRDINGDGWPDLYVCNDFWSPDRIWINDGRGGFRALPRLALRHTSAFSMGVDFADINRDGSDDFMVLDMLSLDHQRRMRQRFMSSPVPYVAGRFNDRPQIERNTLFLNRGDTTFAEIAQLGGVQASEWSWSVVFLDVDLDGFEDMLITTGHDFDTQDADTDDRISKLSPAPKGKFGERLLLNPRLDVPNIAFRNHGGDLTFEEIGTAWGFDDMGVSHGMALADLDLDGDLDVVVNNLNRAAGIYRNDSDAPRVAVQLKGRGLNSHGIGAKIKFRGGPVTQQQEMQSGGRYLSGDAPMRVFAAGLGQGSGTIEVVWRNGARSVVTNVVGNSVYEIAEPEAGTLEPRSAPSVPAQGPALFKDVSRLIQHVAGELPYDDFARQRLLYRRLSQAGPGVAWVDMDQDGWDDLLLGCGRGGAIAFYRNNTLGGFDRLALGKAIGQARDDLTSILGFPAGPGTTRLVFGQSSLETTPTNQTAIFAFDVWAGGFDPVLSLPLPGASVGPLASADIDGDGDLDLFGGGRPGPGRFPEAAPSMLYRFEGGRVRETNAWSALGIVNGATFADLDTDGFPELILACEWGPIRVFHNERGTFTESTQNLGLSKFTGWWNGVTVGDFDEDGLLDMAASNWGRNTPYQPYVAKELRIFYGDLSGLGTTEMIDGYWELSMNKVVPRSNLDRISLALPWARERFSSAAAYAKAGIQEMFESRGIEVREWRANMLETSVFLNRGNHFERRPLPIQAQFAPAFGVAAADADGDGHIDLFLAQNFFGVDETMSRYDAGIGLWLGGDGKGGFTPWDAQRSGVTLHGEQRGAGLADYDRDGRWDLVVTQNGTDTKLFQNVSGKPGRRIRLEGPSGNRSGVGAVVQVRDAQGHGPAYSVAAGSGYASQDSTVLIIHASTRGQSLGVTWPGGKKATVPLTPGEAEVLVKY